MQNVRILLFLAATMVFSSGCGLFSDEGEDPLNVTVEQEVPIEFTIDSEDLCPPDRDCEAEPQPAPERIESPQTVQVPVPIDVVEATGDPELRDISSRVRKIEVTSVSYEVLSNTLNVPTEPVDFFMGPEGSMTSDDEGVVLVTTVPEVPPMQTPSDTSEVSAEAREVTSELFRDLKLTALPSFKPVFEKGEMFPPQGSTDVKMILNMRFTANPKDL